jgi:DNA-binding transcriptional regulator LsrR (DeoR family)
VAQYDVELMIKVAELYYLDDIPQKEIAQKLNISRPKVSRILKSAKENKLIEIRINYPAPARSQLEKTFEKKFNLKETIIVRNLDDDKKRIFSEVTMEAAKYIKRVAKEGDSIGVAWGRTLRAVADIIGISEKKDIKVVQIIGSLGQSSTSANEIVRKMAESFAGNYFVLPAPAIVNSSDIKDAIMKDDTIKNMLQMAREVNIALVGIGNVDENSSFFRSGYLKHEDLKLLKQSKAVGDVCAHFLDIDGNVCTDIDDRVIAISLEDLRKIPRVIGVATGEDKVSSIAGALKSGVLDVLITDEKTAKAVLNDQ